MILVARREIHILVAQGAQNPVCFVASATLAGLGTIGHAVALAAAAFVVSLEHSNKTLKEVCLLHPRPYVLYAAKTVCVMAYILLAMVVLAAASLFLARSAETGMNPTGITNSGLAPTTTMHAVWLVPGFALQCVTFLNLCLAGFIVAVVTRTPTAASGLSLCLFLMIDTLKEILGFEKYVFWSRTNELWNAIAAGADGLDMDCGSVALSACLVGAVSAVIASLFFRLFLWRKVEH
jgi:hypothetical protein